MLRVLLRVQALLRERVLLQVQEPLRERVQVRELLLWEQALRRCLPLWLRYKHYRLL